MLSNFKVKFLSVGKNVKFLKNEKTKKKQVNLDAGVEILDHFQKQWKILHENNECNAKKASEVAENIEIIHNSIDKKKREIQKISEILTNTTLINNINGVTKQIQQLYKICESVENNLIILEDTIDEIEFQKLKTQHEYHLKKYEERNKDKLALLEKELKEKQRRDLEFEEMEKVKEMEERQRVFQEAFKNDLELFKSLGQIPKVDIKKPPSALLEEIQLDFDEKELDQFFDEN